MKRAAPKVEFPDVARVFHAVYPDVDICEFLEVSHEMFPSFPILDLVEQVKRTWGNVSPTTVFESLLKFSELNMNAIIELIVNSFREKNVNQIAELIRKFFPQLTANQILEESLRALPLQCPFVGSAPLNGIISTLTALIGGNVHDKNVVTTRAVTDWLSYPPRNAVDLTGQNELITRGSTNSEWISYDFLDFRIILTHYSVRSRCGSGKGSYHPLSWTFEGSADGSSWQSLDTQNNNHSLDEQNVVRKFPAACTTRLRYVRFRITGPNSAGNHQLCLSGLELFGTLTGK
jgi:hypothetical protein